MVKRIMSRLMMGFVMAVLVVGFAQVLAPTPLRAGHCEHEGYPPCPTGTTFKFCTQWDGHCCMCSGCKDNITGWIQEVCWID